MIVDRWYRALTGRVRFQAEGGFALRLPGECARAGIWLENLTLTPLGFIAEVRPSDYKRIARLAKKTRTRVHLLEKHGLGLWWFHHRERRWFFLGLAAGLALIVLWGRFLWVIDIDGELEHYTEADLRVQLASFGLREGAVTAELDPGWIEREMMIANDDLAFIAVNFRGSLAEVIVRQRERAEPEPGTGGRPANVVSLYDGVVRSVEVTSGSPQVEVGDTVRAGDLLISAIVETQNGVSTVHQASGRVLIEHEAYLSTAVPLAEEVLVPTGERRVCRSLTLFGMELPLSFGSPAGPYLLTAREKQLSAFGVPLPVQLTVREYRLAERTERHHTEAEAEALAEEALQALEAEQFSDAEILERVPSGRLEGDTFLLTARYLLLEDAALERSFEVSP